MRLTAIICILLALATSAYAKSYKYTDSAGVIHLTNKSQDIPQQYRAEARELQDDKRTDGFTPPAQSALTGNSPAWTKEDSATGAVRKSVGTLKNLMDSISEPKVLVGIGIALTLIIPGLTMLLIKKNSLRLIIIGILLSCAYMALFSVYMQNAMDRKEQVYKSMEKAFKEAEKKNEVTKELLKE